MSEERLPVYRMINGVLFRIPGDQRSARRQYALHSDVAGLYYSELTQDEEIQLDHEQSDWTKPESQFDIEVAETRADAVVRFRESIKYERRTLAFIDVLGWRAAVDRSSTDTQLTQKIGSVLGLSLSHAQSMQTEAFSVLTDSLRVTHFSDSIVLSVSNGPATQFLFWIYLQNLIWSLIDIGFLVRGGIAEDLVLHRDNMIFGPALNRAYDLEHGSAKFPRVILDHALASSWSEGMPIAHPGSTSKSSATCWYRDDDGYWFFDFLRPYALISGAPGALLSATRDHLLRMRTLLADRLEEYRNTPDVYGKYEWAVTYFNKVADENPDAKVSPIPLL